MIMIEKHMDSKATLSYPFPMKAIGVLPSHCACHIDHLVPLCQILGIPLLLTDPMMKETIEWYYPPMELILDMPDDHCLDAALEGYDLFVYAEFFRKGNGSFRFAHYGTRKRARSLYTLHGNSDKWRDIFWMEKLADEDKVLLYGPQMIDYMHEKGVFKPVIQCGNYRLEYYLANRAFFDAKLSLPKGKTTILYAPTWTSSNRGTEMRFDFSSYLEAHKHLFEKIPENFQLIVKLHPHMSLHVPEIEEVKKKYPHLLFIDDCPLIYPLLNLVDIYLGDHSSTGYDFLYFNRPLFFLNNRAPTYLHNCGISIETENFSSAYEIIQENLDEQPFSSERQQAYAYAFGEKMPLDRLRQEVGLHAH